MERVKTAEKAAESFTAWRIDATLREFPKFPAVNVWFKYPVHECDNIGILADIEPEGERAPWKQNFGKKKSKEEKETERKGAVDTAYQALTLNEQVTVSDMANYMDVSEKTARRRIKENGHYFIDEGVVVKR
jgi:RecA-family ATPase